MMRYKLITLIVIALTISLFSIWALNAQEERSDNSFGPKVVLLDKVGPEDVLGYLFDSVLFRHKYHAKIVKDCSVCHHFFNEHYNDQVVSSQRCQECHLAENFDSMSRCLACDTCHEPNSSPEVRNIRSNNGVLLRIPGLKAAYHRNCIDCHNDMCAPSGCGDCHLARVPDHSELISDFKGASTCEECHPGKIAEVQRTTHYRLSKSLSHDYLSSASGEPRPKEAGMLNRPGRLWGTSALDAWDVESDSSCKKCHIGSGSIPNYTQSDDEISETEIINVDCLICHVHEGYPLSLNDRFDKDFTLAPGIEKLVGHTTSENCQRCHTALTSIPASDAVSPVYSDLRGTAFEPESDIHAELGMACFNCHYARDHMFKRQVSASVQAADFPCPEQGCVRCHRDIHVTDEYLMMTTIIACTGCHIPDTGGPIEINFEDKSKPTQLKSRVVFKWFNRTTNWFGEPFGSRLDGMLYQYRVGIIREPLDIDGNPIPIDITTGKPKSDEIRSWREREVYLPISHGVQLDNAYTCSDCHSKNSKFNWSDMQIEIPIFE